MIREIQAKVLLTRIRDPNAWFGVRYNLNMYRGCEHQCIYCDSRSECYQIEDFRDVLVKVNAIELLQRELAGKRVKGVVGSGAMSDPYTYAEERYQLTRRSLQVMHDRGFGAHLTTKSDRVLRDLDILAQIARATHASVAMTLTTLDDDLAAKVEPGAPRPSARLAAMRALAQAGVTVAVALMPILPFIEDTEANVSAIARGAAAAGARYLVPWFAVTLRDRQRAYYYEQLDRHFPGLRERYERRYGEHYSCPAPNAKALEVRLREVCAEVGLEMGMPGAPPEAEQLPLL